MAILSVNSRVARGTVGNAVAGPAMLALGVEPWCVDTTRLSNHPGHATVNGATTSKDDLRTMINSVLNLSAPSAPPCLAISSGYMGSIENGLEVIEAVRLARQGDNPLLYFCDPVMGDCEEGIYVADDLVTFFKEQAVPTADVVIPNQFELEALTEGPVRDLGEAVAAAQMLRGPTSEKIVVVSSLKTPDFSPDLIGTLLVTCEGEWLVETPLLRRNAKGAGDLMAALFVAQLVKLTSPLRAFRHAVSATYSVLNATPKASLDLELYGNLDLLPNPPMMFECKAVA